MFIHDWDTGAVVDVNRSACDVCGYTHDELRRIDLAITDQAMPGRTGVELTRDLLAPKPGLPVILYTGFSEGIPRAELDAAALRGVLVKPVDPHELYGLLHTWLPVAGSE
ncbi:MAG: response regulator [Burkholderiales bacterium]|nr:response regulator [Burkholderiales bacterium]